MQGLPGRQAHSPHSGDWMKMGPGRSALREERSPFPEGRWGAPSWPESLAPLLAQQGRLQDLAGRGQAQPAAAGSERPPHRLPCLATSMVASAAWTWGGWGGEGLLTDRMA